MSSGADHCHISSQVSVRKSVPVDSKKSLSFLLFLGYIINVRIKSYAAILNTFLIKCITNLFTWLRQNVTK